MAALAVRHSQLMQQVTASMAVQEADSLKSALLAAVSHELRTPLGSIEAAVTALLEPGQAWDDEGRVEFLTAIDEETDRLTSFVNNLLDLSRIEGGALHQTRDWYDLREFLETVTDRLAPVTAEHRVAIEASDGAGDGYFDYVRRTGTPGTSAGRAAPFRGPARGAV